MTLNCRVLLGTSMYPAKINAPLVCCHQRFASYDYLKLPFEIVVCSLRKREYFYSLFYFIYFQSYRSNIGDLISNNVGIKESSFFALFQSRMVVRRWFPRDEWSHEVPIRDSNHPSARWLQQREPASDDICG